LRGPPGVDTDDDVLTVIPHVVDAVQTIQADAFIIACFSDPGLDQARRATQRPVLGIGEAAYLTAMGVAGRFGVISDQDYSIPRHLARLEHMRLSGRRAGDRAIGVSIGDLEGPEVYEKLCAVGRTLRDIDRADVIILGCAGMGPYRERLQQSLGLPVIDPVQAAVAQACAFSLMDIADVRMRRED
jgi:Asp/Glu/hydantoin racemase